MVAMLAAMACHAFRRYGRPGIGRRRSVGRRARHLRARTLSASRCLTYDALAATLPRRHEDGRTPTTDARAARCNGVRHPAHRSNSTASSSFLSGFCLAPSVHSCNSGGAMTVRAQAANTSSSQPCSRQRPRGSGVDPHGEGLPFGSGVAPDVAPGAHFIQWPPAAIPVFVGMLFGAMLGGNAPLIGASPPTSCPPAFARAGRPVTFGKFSRWAAGHFRPARGGGDLRPRVVAIGALIAPWSRAIAPAIPMHCTKMRREKHYREHFVRLTACVTHRSLDLSPTWARQTSAAHRPRH